MNKNPHGKHGNRARRLITGCAGNRCGKWGVEASLGHNPKSRKSWKKDWPIKTEWKLQLKMQKKLLR